MASLLHRFGFLLGVLSLTGVNTPLSASSGSGIITSSPLPIDAKFDGSIIINGSVDGIGLIPVSLSEPSYLYNGDQLIKITSESESLVRYDYLKRHIININKTINSSEHIEQSAGNISFEYNERNMISNIIGDHGTSFHLYYDENDKIRKIVNFSGLIVYELTASPLGASSIWNKEKQFDKITLIFSGAFPSEYHEVSYYRNAENAWNFSYDRKFTFGSPL